MASNSKTVGLATGPAPHFSAHPSMQVFGENRPQDKCPRRALSKHLAISSSADAWCRESIVSTRLEPLR